MPNEFLEAYFPLRIETYESITDSGGAGYNRGGNGIRMGYRFLEDGEISIHDDRWLTYPWGVNGANPGWRSTKNWCVLPVKQKCFRQNVTVLK